MSFGLEIDEAVATTFREPEICPIFDEQGYHPQVWSIMLELDRILSSTDGGRQ